MLSPKGKPRRAAAALSTELLLLVSYRGNAMLGSRATDKGTCTRISCMRVMFWLSRAYAPLWWDSNYASNDPLLRHPALPAVFTCQSLEYRERTKHTVELSSCQHDRKKRLRRACSRSGARTADEKGGFPAPRYKLRAGCKSGIAAASNPPSRSSTRMT